jgi:hypothetical protein
MASATRMRLSSKEGHSCGGIGEKGGRKGVPVVGGGERSEVTSHEHQNTCAGWSMELVAVCSQFGRWCICQSSCITLMAVSMDVAHFLFLHHPKPILQTPKCQTKLQASYQRNRKGDPIKCHHRSRQLYSDRIFQGKTQPRRNL